MEKRDKMRNFKTLKIYQPYGTIFRKKIARPSQSVAIVAIL